MSFDTLWRDFERLFRRRHRLGDPILPHVESRKLGQHVACRRIERRRPLECGDGAIDVLFAFEQTAAQILVVRFGNAAG